MALPGDHMGRGTEFGMRFIGRFFLWVFAVVGFLIILVGASLTTWFMLSGESEESLPDKIVLSLDLNRGVSETRSEGPLQLLSRGGPYALRDVIAGLQKAETDPHVAGALVRMGASGVDIATAQELRDAVSRFRKAGKFAVAYADSFSAEPGATAEYYLASGFNEIWMQPSGELSTTGVAIEVPFVAGALEKIGVVARMEQRKEYKSSPETFTHKNMSAPVRSNLQALVDSWLAQFVRGIAEGRHISADEARAAIDQSPLLGAEALKRKLVDGLDYWPAASEAVEKRAGANAGLVSLKRYLANGKVPYSSGPTVALVYGVGPIVSGGDEGSVLDSSRVFAAHEVAKAISEAAADPDVRAILLRINSPGGSYLAADTVWDAVMRARAAGTPVIASMGGIAASGGYFVAMGADRIIALPGTLTGSIGVYGGKFVTEGLWPKLGVTWDIVQAGKNAALWSPFRDYPPDAKARLDAMMDAVYADFTTKLAKGRNIKAAQVDQVAGGRVWSGEAASKVGLVDQLGGLKTAIDAAKQVAGLKPEESVTLKEYPLPKTPLERIFALMEDDGGSVAARVFDWLGLRSQVSTLVETQVGPVLKELGVLRPRAGDLQMPPLKLRY
jgi:protease IV